MIEEERRGNDIRGMRGDRRQRRKRGRGEEATTMRGLKLRREEVTANERMERRERRPRPTAFKDKTDQWSRPTRLGGETVGERRELATTMQHGLGRASS